MAANDKDVVASLVYDFLLTQDQSLAKVFQKKSKASPLPKGSPSILQIVKDYQGLSPNTKKIPFFKKKKDDSDSSSESEDEAPKKAAPPVLNGKTTKTPTKKASSSSDSDDSSEDEAPAKTKPTASPGMTNGKPALKAVPAKKKESSSEESSSEDDAPAKTPAKTPVRTPVAAVTKKTPVKKESSSEDSSSEDEVPAKKPALPTPAKKAPVAAKKESSSDEDSSSEDEKVPTKAAPKPAPAKAATKKKDSSSSEESSEDEAPKSKVAVAKPTIKAVTAVKKKAESSSEDSSRMGCPTLPFEDAMSFFSEGFRSDIEKLITSGGVMELDVTSETKASLKQLTLELCTLAKLQGTKFTTVVKAKRKGGKFVKLLLINCRDKRYEGMVAPSEIALPDQAAMLKETSNPMSIETAKTYFSHEFLSDLKSMVKEGGEIEMAVTEEHNPSLRELVLAFDALSRLYGAPFRNVITRRGDDRFLTISCFSNDPEENSTTSMSIAEAMAFFSEGFLLGIERMVVNGGVMETDVTNETKASLDQLMLALDALARLHGTQFCTVTERWSDKPCLLISCLNQRSKEIVPKADKSTQPMSTQEAVAYFTDEFLFDIENMVRGGNRANLDVSKLNARSRKKLMLALDALSRLHQTPFKTVLKRRGQLQDLIISRLKKRPKGVVSSKDIAVSSGFFALHDGIVALKNVAQTVTSEEANVQFSDEFVCNIEKMIDSGKSAEMDVTKEDSASRKRLITSLDALALLHRTRFRCDVESRGDQQYLIVSCPDKRSKGSIAVNNGKLLRIKKLKTSSSTE